MATLAFFHAHPDDEAIATGGTMITAADAGHRVVLVFATRGEQGIPADGVLDDGELLGDRRTAESLRSGEILGAGRVEFLGFGDSGMINEPTNDDPGCFWQADVEDAAAQLAAILLDEDVDLLSIYDDHGGYGHPDHIQVHRVGKRAAEMAGTARVVQSTMNRDAILRTMAEAEDEGLDEEMAEARANIESGEQPFGSTEDEITHAIDVRAVLDRKRASMAAHASQITEESFFFAMSEDAFADAFGTEWYIDLHHPRARDESFRTSLL